MAVSLCDTAMILAAGKGSRLGALTAGIPKPMLPLGGRPILHWTIERLAAAGIVKIVINLHHAGSMIRDSLGSGAAFGIQIEYSDEPEILGTAGGVKKAQPMLGNRPFLVVYGDNVQDWDPGLIIRAHVAYRPLATIAVAEIPDARQSGIVQFGPDMRISAFVEKPGQTLADPRGWVNAGVYIVEPDIFDHIPTQKFSDFGFDVFPRVLAQDLPMRALCLARPPLAIDTPANYAHAQATWVTRV